MGKRLTVSSTSKIERRKGDATPFRKLDVNDIKKELKQLGYESNGYVRMCDGMTGEMMKALIFMGPVYYQRLKHLVSEKIHARANGPKTALLHGPTEGKKNEGGLRVSELMRDCFLAQGSSFVIKDRLMEQSDRYKCWVCKVCGLIANYNPESDVKECRVCEVDGDEFIKLITLPYSMKLVIQELIAINVGVRILVDPDDKGKITIKVN